MNQAKHSGLIALIMDRRYAIPWMVLLGVVGLFMMILYPNLVIPQKQYQVGDVVKQDIKAKEDFFIEDQAATEARREEAAASILTVYDLDAGLGDKIAERVHQAFETIRAVYRDYEERQHVIAVQNELAPGSVKPLDDDLPERIAARKADFQESLGISVSDGAYALLEDNRFSKDIEQYIIQILAEIFNNGVVANKEMLLGESDRGITLRDIADKTETVARNLRKFYGLDQAKTMVRIIGQPLLNDENYILRNLVVDFAQRLIQPNITLNRSETEERKQAAAAEIKPILYQIKAGEMIIREGERVSDFDLLKLKKASSSSTEKRSVSSMLGAALIMVCLLLTIYIPHVQSRRRFTRHLNKNLLFVGAMLVSFLLLARIAGFMADVLVASFPFSVTAETLYWGIPMAAGAMIVCLFHGMEVAIPYAVVIAVGASAFFRNSYAMFIYFLLNHIMAAYWTQECRERNVFIKAGFKIGLMNIVLVTAIDAYLGEVSEISLLMDWSFAFLGGLVTGIIAAGVAPIMEAAFGYTTDIKLLELANLDRPILRRLMLEAPGTYHHSVLVGSLVEAAASDIGANPLMAKVCGYYHDIGKIKKPLYFIENQTDGVNRHDKLAPSMSKRILISHVKDGVEMAGQHRLGEFITDVIRQSHGTSVITYFYNKAIKRHGDEKVNMDDYRYPGPRPQTREAGLVMLADVVEAASRTLDNPTPSRIQGLVQNLINKVFSDGQLDACELTLKDLHSIAKSFTKILTGIHHHRIDYPEKATGSNGKGANGSADRQPAESPPRGSSGHSEESGRHLRRLGQS